MTDQPSVSSSMKVVLVVQHCSSFTDSLISREFRLITEKLMDIDQISPNLHRHVFTNSHPSRTGTYLISIKFDSDDAVLVSFLVYIQNLSHPQKFDIIQGAESLALRSLEFDDKSLVAIEIDWFLINGYQKYWNQLQQALNDRSMFNSRHNRVSVRVIDY